MLRWHDASPQGEAIIQRSVLSFRWERMVLLIRISKPADYHISHFFSISAQHAKGGLSRNVSSQCCKLIFQCARIVRQRKKQAPAREETEKWGWASYEIFPLSVCVKNQPQICSLWSFSHLFRSRPRVCKGAGRDEHKWYCGSHMLCLLKFHNR